MHSIVPLRYNFHRQVKSKKVFVFFFFNVQGLFVEANVLFVIKHHRCMRAIL